jgi:uncharacterized protein YggT (Ycf19 family)
LFPQAEETPGTRVLVVVIAPPLAMVIRTTLPVARESEFAVLVPMAKLRGVEPVVNIYAVVLPASPKIAEEFPLLRMMNCKRAKFPSSERFITPAADAPLEILRNSSVPAAFVFAPIARILVPLAGVYVAPTVAVVYAGFASATTVQVFVAVQL